MILFTGHDHFLVSHDYNEYSNVQKYVNIDYQYKELRVGWSSIAFVESADFHLTDL